MLCIQYSIHALHLAWHLELEDTLLCASLYKLSTMLKLQEARLLNDMKKTTILVHRQLLTFPITR